LSNKNDVIGQVSGLKVEEKTGGLDIVVFDDNPNDFELLQYHLRQMEGIRLHYCSNFSDFKEIISKEKVSAIVCDYGLGAMTGLEVYEYSKSVNIEAPFIIVSGALGEDRAVDILRTGVTDYVLKDKFDKLPFVIDRAVKEYESRQSEKIMLERLKQSESKFREIFNSIIDVFFQTDENGIQRIISPSVESVIGYKPEELIGTPAEEIYENPRQREELLALFKENEIITDYEINVICKNGDVKPVSVNVKILLDENGNHTGIQGIYRDISHRKKQEIKLVKRETQLRESQIMANLGSWELNIETRRFILSDELFKIFELAADKKERKDFYEFSALIHSDDRARLESNMIKFMKTGNELPYEFRIITPTGKLKYVSMKVFKSRKNEVSEYLSGIIQDITDLKLLEEEKNNVQRQALEMLEEMVEQRTRKIEEQRTVIELKNRDITDSIRYAKQVQMAMMPSKSSIDECLAHNFMIYLPKDIVAGDFYWSYSDQDTFMFAVADCTGHGVPGALVSLICSSTLNRVVRDFGVTLPGEILDQTNDLVVDFFSKGVTEVKDGMDVSLIVVNYKKREITWAGANNPLIYFDGEDCVKVLPDKMAIGHKENDEKYTSHIIPYLLDTTYYMYSDGYADQFGGGNNKKFMQKRLFSLMEIARNKTMAKQEKLFMDTFIEWKGDNEQVDDVALFGFKLPELKS
jgi:PAS domain S-box-containing protein